MKITVLTASSRGKNAIGVVDESLKRQTFTDFEWLLDRDTTKNEEDFYGLNKAWNRLIKKSKGELLVFVCDWTELPPNALGKFWKHYQKDKKSCVNGVGYQYYQGEKVWDDERLKLVKGKGLCWIVPQHNEFRLASIPRKAAFDVGGLDEEYDKVAANSEKEFALRMYSKGYEFYLDKTLKFKFYQHEPHGEAWDKKYLESSQLLKKHFDEILENRREMVYYL